MREVLRGERGHGPAAEAATGDETALTAPVIVLTYAHSGAELLTQMLSASRSLACTSTTGLVPLCHEAVSTWQQAEGKDGPPSSLAIRSIRALATTMITVIRARAGAPRWCETAFASSGAARTFLQVFPATTFLCLHRSMQGVLAEAARAYPWGLGGSPFWGFSAGHQGNNVATVAAYWANRTGILLDFEAGHPDSTLRVRYEDLAADRDRQASEIFAALGLDPRDLAVLREPEPARPAAMPLADFVQPVPVSLIPPQLLASVRDLHARLAYDPWPE